MAHHKELTVTVTPSQNEPEELEPWEEIYISYFRLPKIFFKKELEVVRVECWFQESQTTLLQDYHSKGCHLYYEHNSLKTYFLFHISLK